MVLVGMGTDHIIQLLHLLLFQIGIDHVRILRVSAVDQHAFPVAEHQGCVRLAHVDEMDFKAGTVHRLFRRQLCPGAVSAAGNKSCRQQHRKQEPGGPTACSFLPPAPYFLFVSDLFHSNSSFLLSFLPQSGLLYSEREKKATRLPSQSFPPETLKKKRNPL